MTPPDKLFRDNRIEFFLVCVGSIDNIEQVFLCWEDTAFFECECNLVKALVNLIAAYYVYDVKYPQCMIGVLLLLPEVVLLQKETKFKGAKYASFLAEFQKSCRKDWEIVIKCI